MMMFSLWLFKPLGSIKKRSVQRGSTWKIIMPHSKVLIDVQLQLCSRRGLESHCHFQVSSFIHTCQQQEANFPDGTVIYTQTWPTMHLWIKVFKCTDTNDLTYSSFPGSHLLMHAVVIVYETPAWVKTQYSVYVVCMTDGFLPWNLLSALVKPPLWFWLTSVETAVLMCHSNESVL